MADISQNIQQIKTAIYGEEVRESICNAIESINAEASEAHDVAIDSQSSASEILDEIKGYEQFNGFAVLQKNPDQSIIDSYPDGAIWIATDE